MSYNEVKLSGPLFDGRAEGVIPAYLDEAYRDVADYGVSLIQEIVTTNANQPTGRYVKAVHAEAGPTSTRVTDGGIVYGPWLEGFSKRNQTSRFKGFVAFRVTRKQLDSGKAKEIAEGTLRKYIGRLS